MKASISNADPRRRESALTRLESETFDLLVIGAGITGSRVAYEAALHGLRVALIDAGDIGGATSSASSKLVHGGLRYLEHADLRLVRESQTEKRALIERVAPGLVHPLPFVLLGQRDGGLASRYLGAGFMLYEALSGFHEASATRLSVEAAGELVPGLRTENLAAAWLYSEGQTNDARLTLATAKAASDAGAVVINHAALIEFGIQGGRVRSALVESHTGEGLITIRFRAAVNAGGPWVDAIRRLENPRSSPVARLSKGVHLLLPLPEGFETAVAVPVGGTRATFAVPWEGMLLLGTTDTEYDGDPKRLSVEEADVQMVLAEAATMLSSSIVREDLIHHSFAGLRALPVGQGATAFAPREHFVTEGRDGLVSIAGGKLTTHRRIAIDVLRALPSDVRPRGLRPSGLPLPGFATSPQSRPEELDDASWSYLVSHYGSEVGQLVSNPDGESADLAVIDPRGPDIWAQVRYAIDREWAVTVDDVLCRRTTVAMRGLRSAQVEERVGVMLRDQPRVAEGGPTK